MNGRNHSKEIECRFDEVKAFLDMRWDNDRGIHAAIDKAFVEIIKKGLVKQYRWEKLYPRNRRYILTLEKDIKGPAKASENSYNLVKIPA